MKISIKLALLLLLAFFTILMMRITIPYFSFDDQTAFLKIKQWIIHNQVWKISFYIHVITSCFCLLAGFTQFSKRFLKSNPQLHRGIGKLYIIIILFLSGPSGFIMSIYANGGTLSQIAFLSLSSLWILFTYLGYYHIRKGNYSKHQQYLMRSYALTLSAITLRAWKYIIAMAFRPSPMDLYMIVAWLGWIPNLLFIEWYIRTRLSTTKLSFK